MHVLTAQFQGVTVAPVAALENVRLSQNVKNDSQI